MVKAIVIIMTILAMTGFVEIGEMIIKEVKNEK